MTVRDHMKQAGYDPDTAWNVDYLRRWPEIGMMECEKAEIKTFRCRPALYEEEMLGVEAVAVVRFSDGYDHPLYFGGDITASITAYFPIAAP